VWSKIPKSCGTTCGKWNFNLKLKIQPWKWNKHCRKVHETLSFYQQIGVYQIGSKDNSLFIDNEFSLQK
jgi:hypothetical protein